MCRERGREARHEALEEATYSRARYGVERITYFRGQEIGRYREFSDRLAELHLAAQEPGRYGRRGDGAGVQVHAGVKIVFEYHADSPPDRVDAPPERVIDVEET